MAVAYPIPAVSGVLNPSAGNSVVSIAGFSVSEAAGSPGLGKLNIREGVVGGKILVSIGLLASTSQTHSFACGVVCNGAVYCEITGTVTGAIWVE